MPQLHPVFFAALLALIGAPPAHALTLQTFTPQGEAPNTRQVKAAFDEAVATFGDPSGKPVPFQVDCPERGSGRWLDEKTWVYDFTRDLPAGVSCRFTVTPGLTSRKGQAYEGEPSFAFDTGGPMILESAPYRWGLTEDAVVVLTLNAEYDPSSLENYAYFRVPHVLSPYRVTVVTGKERDEVVEHALGSWRVKQMKKDALARTVVLRSLQNLPQGKTVELVLGKGVATKAGVARKTDQTWEYEVRDAFKITFECERENPEAACIPFSPLRLALTASVARAQAAAVTLKITEGPDAGKTFQPKFGKDQAYVDRIEFTGPFPANTSFAVTLPVEFRDEAGRSAVNAQKFPLDVRTAAYPPLVKFAANFGILEADGNPQLPVAIRKVEADLAAKVYTPLPVGANRNPFRKVIDLFKSRLFRLPLDETPHIMAWLERLDTRKAGMPLLPAVDDKVSGDYATILLKDQKLPSTDRQLKRDDPKATEVLGIPLQGPGFYLIEAHSQVLGKALLAKDAPYVAATAALVTNMAVHFKRGAESSVVWVTSLNRALPIPDTLVSVWDCKGKLYAKGKTDKSGLFKIDSALPPDENLPRCNEESGSAYATGMLVLAEKAGDVSFVHTSWDRGIEPWRFQLPQEYARHASSAHTVMDRTLLRAGDTLHMKHLIRARSQDGFSSVPANQRPMQLVLQHQASDQKYEFPVSWDDNGIAETEWKVPPNAKLGSYRVYLTKPAGATEDRWEDQLQTGEFRVEEFRVPLMKAEVRTEGPELVAPKALSYDLGVSYLAGGSAGNLPISFRARMDGYHQPQFKNYDAYTFASEPVRVGLRAVKDSEETKSREIHATETQLDQNGTAKVRIAQPPVEVYPYAVATELEYKDPNGEVQTVGHRQVVWPSSLVVGLKAVDWGRAKDPLSLGVAVLTPQGKPVKDVAVTVKAYARKLISHRKRLIGGFYAYEETEDVRPLGGVCSGKTNNQGLLPCEKTLAQSGQILLEAQVQDKAGRKTYAVRTLYRSGEDDWDFEREDHDRIDLVTDKPTYQVGDKAKVQVRLPFRAGVALVTIEREGVLDARVQRVSAKNPIVEIPIKGNYAPNVFASVLVLRGRVKSPKPTFTTDLAKPAYKLGIIPLKVGIEGHRLDVDVQTDQQVYKVRDEVTVNLTATQNGKAPGEKVEAAVAVIDEGLLELGANRSWDLLTAMLGERGIAVRTFTAAMQVVGKRHFGLKARADGGGGGAEATRTLFDTLVFWQSRVRFDSNGKATVKFPLNDSLTSFRVVAIASGGLGLFGTGDTKIATTRDVMVFAGLPLAARNGDQIKASFTLRNATKEPKQLDVALDAKGVKQDLPVKRLKLAGEASQEVSWNLKLPESYDKVSYQLDVLEGGKVIDRLAIEQKLTEAVPERSLQAKLVQIDKEATIPVKAPAVPATGGGIYVNLRPSLGSGLTGVERYMHDYPYSCLEQRISRTVALSDEAGWQQITGSLPAYLDGDGFAKFYSSSYEGDATLTAYLLEMAQLSDYQLDSVVKDRMVTALSGFVNGTLNRPSLVAGPDLLMRRLLALAALARQGAASAAMLESFPAVKSEWPLPTLIDYFQVLQRVPDAPEREARIKRTVTLIRNHLTLRGTAMTLADSAQARYWWLMRSPDADAARLLLASLEFETLASDAPKLAQGLVSRLPRDGHFDLTTANALATLAFKKFSARYETTAVKGTTEAALGSEVRNLDWSQVPRTLVLPWPPQGKEAQVVIKQDGPGAPWAVVESRARVPLTAPVAAGYQVKRTLTPVRRKDSTKWQVGDIIKVDLEVEAQSDMGYVVVDDPVPTGATILGTGLARQNVATAETQDGPWQDTYPVYRENGFTAMRAYYDWVPKGTFKLSYSFRLNNAGEFHLPATRVEAMYAPDVYGEVPNEGMKVEP